jgi:hypothetical protein
MPEGAPAMIDRNQRARRVLAWEVFSGFRPLMPGVVLMVGFVLVASSKSIQAEEPRRLDQVIVDGAIATAGYLTESVSGDSPEPVIQQVQFGASDFSTDPFEAYGVTQTKAGSSATSLRKQAAGDIPLHQVRDVDRERVQKILKETSLYRRLPTLTYEVEPEVHRFFVQQPDVAVSTWRAMEISKFELQEVKPNVYHADARDGSVGTIEVLYRTAEDTLILCEGAFKSPVVSKPIQSRAIMRVQASFAEQPSGRTICTQTCDIFVEFPSHTVETIAKIIAPVSYHIADRNFKQITLYVRMMSLMMCRQPSWVEELTKKMDGVPDSRKTEMLGICEACFARTTSQAAIASGNQLLPIDELVNPLKKALEATDTPQDSSRAGRTASRPEREKAKR